MRTRGTILVSGMLAGTPWQGGATWAVLQYLLGLRKLGHEAYLVEPLREQDLQPHGAHLADSENAAYFAQVTHDFGLQNNAALLLGGTSETFGLPYPALVEVARRTDVLINISGMLTDQNLTSRAPIRIYLDLDPAFNQLWSAVQGIDMRYAAHTHYVTIGLNIGDADCPVPTCGLNWLKTLQPVCLDRWPITPSLEYPALTTIGNWRGYGSITHRGIHYGQKAHSVRQFIELPKRVSEKFMLALAIHQTETDDLARLRQYGWDLLDPTEVAQTPADYQRFIQNSKAELGICKSGYAVSRCAWFSDRSLCYLASGKPVIAQSTGFERYLPCGKGLFAFEDTSQAVAAINAMNADYPAHCSAARQIAEEYFDSDKVLDRLLTLVAA